MTGDQTGVSGGMEKTDMRLDHRDYRRLSDFRYLIRCFLEFSETAAAGAGLTARQHQVLQQSKVCGRTPSRPSVTWHSGCASSTTARWNW